MAKMYTLDSKLLTGRPEIRIGEKVYAVDDRKKTVQKMIAIFEDVKSEKDEFAKLDEISKLAFGEKYKEIEKMDLSFAAYRELCQLVLQAATGEEEKDSPETFRES